VITEHADGSVEVKLKVCLTPELDNLILPWAGHVQAVSPAPLRKKMREYGEALIRDH
jgi:hypothetical protein